MKDCTSAHCQRWRRVNSPNRPRCTSYFITRLPSYFLHAELMTDLFHHSYWRANQRSHYLNCLSKHRELSVVTGQIILKGNLFVVKSKQNVDFMDARLASILVQLPGTFQQERTSGENQNNEIPFSKFHPLGILGSWQCREDISRADAVNRCDSPGIFILDLYDLDQSLNQLPEYMFIPLNPQNAPTMHPTTDEASCNACVMWKT